MKVGMQHRENWTAETNCHDGEASECIRVAYFSFLGLVYFFSSCFFLPDSLICISFFLHHSQQPIPGFPLAEADLDPRPVEAVTPCIERHGPAIPKQYCTKAVMRALLLGTGGR